MNGDKENTILLKCIGSLLALTSIVCAQNATQNTRITQAAFEKQARAIHQNALVLDSHIDAPYRLVRHPANLGQRLATGHFDFVRAREGGLDAAVFSIYVASRFDYSGATQNGAYAEAQRVLQLVESVLAQNSTVAAQALSPSAVLGLAQAGKFAVILGLENGSAIENDLGNLRTLAQRGVCYVTLTHSKDNQIADASYDRRRTHRGLSPFGKQVVREMNRLGVMIDVSHISDAAFWQVLALTHSPVIASHSSLRRFRHMQRNLSDSMLVAIKKNGGVVQINFGSFFLSEAFQSSVVKQDRKIAEARAAFKGEPADLENALEKIRAEFPIMNATFADLLRHLDYAVKLIGVDHVGLGSDFDGVDIVPQGLEDVTCYPKITAALLQSGYTEGEVRKIMGENFLRVWQENLNRRF